jgi:MSHA biogenesis protein MshN
MSVINTMLQDLDRRRVELGVKSGYQHVRVIAPAPSFRPIVMLGVGLAVIATGTVWYGYQRSQSTASAALVVKPADASKLVQASAGQASMAARNEIPSESGLTLVASHDMRACEHKGGEAGGQCPNSPQAVSGTPTAGKDIGPTIPATSISDSRSRETARAVEVKVTIAPAMVARLAPSAAGVTAVPSSSAKQQGKVPAMPADEMAVTGVRQEDRNTTTPIEGKAWVAPSEMASQSGQSISHSTQRPVSGVPEMLKQVSPQQRADAEFALASERFNQGQLAQAIEGFGRALALDTRHDAARQSLVGALLNAKRGAEAERLLWERLNMAPDHAGFATILARLQAERGDSEGALATLGATLPWAANNAGYHATMAALQARQGQHGHAIAHYQAALRLAPNSGVWWMGLGLSFQASGRNAEAVEALQRARGGSNLSPDLIAFVEQRLKHLQ